MADLNLTQAEAEALIRMEKQRVNEQWYNFPWHGETLALPLQSPDKREMFFLDINRGRIDFSKVTYQNRARQVVVLVRFDLTGPPHRNPDGGDIPCPHLHRYREGYGDKWAEPISAEHFSSTSDIWVMLQDFMRYCNITQPPHIERGLFL